MRIILCQSCAGRVKGIGVFEGFRLTLFIMSQYQSFFINAFGDSSQCDELNHFLRSHVVIGFGMI